MRSRLTLASLLLLLPALPAAASVPGSITGLLGNDIGFFLAQSDFCHWNMTIKIHSTYDSAFAQIGMTAGQQAQLARCGDAAESVGGPAAAAITRMKAVCTPATQARIVTLLGS